MIRIICDTKSEKQKISRILRLGEAVLLSVECIIKQEIWEGNKKGLIQWEVRNDES